MYHAEYQSWVSRQPSLCPTSRSAETGGDYPHTNLLPTILFEQLDDLADFHKLLDRAK
jgi:hypothetical protein